MHPRVYGYGCIKAFALNEATLTYELPNPKQKTTYYHEETGKS
jgi:hypothetical protein